MNPELPKDCIGCMHAAKDWATYPCSVCQDGECYKGTRPLLALKIANQLNRACALEITTTAIETIEECLGEDMHTEKNLRLTGKIADEDEREHDLEVWRQAYNAALNGVYYIVGAKTCCTFAAEVADCALADYRAQREELLNEHG